MSELKMRPREYAVLWRNLHRWEKFYTATGSAGSNKSHLCKHAALSLKPADPEKLSMSA